MASQDLDSDETRTFLVQGSAPDPYEVQFFRRGTNLSAYCTCPAGMVGQYCKHRFAIMGGDTRAVVSGNEHEASDVRSWIPGSDVAVALSALGDAEDHLAEAKQAVSSAKRRVAAAMRD